MWAYHNEREQVVWIRLPPPGSAALGEALRVGPGETLFFNAAGQDWITVEDADGLMLKNGYVWELATPDLS